MTSPSWSKTKSAGVVVLQGFQDILTPTTLNQTLFVISTIWIVFTMPVSQETAARADKPLNVCSYGFLYCCVSARILELTLY